MDQVKFLWLSNSIPNKINVTQTEDGPIVVHLRKNIEITHDYRNRNRMEILLKDDNSKYVIPNYKSLVEIYKMHMNNEEVMYILHKYCEEKLGKCE